MGTWEQEYIFDLLHAINRAHRAWKKADLQTNINRSQLFTMITLRNQSADRHEAVDCDSQYPFYAMTLSELARAMQQTMPAVSQKITKLTEIGYVKRTPDNSDRRTVWISLTEKGNTAVEENRKILFQHMEHVISLMERQDPQSVEQLIDNCNRLADAVQEEFNT